MGWLEYGLRMRYGHVAWGVACGLSLSQFLPPAGVWVGAGVLAVLGMAGMVATENRER